MRTPMAKARLDGRSLAKPVPAFRRFANNLFRKTEINATIRSVMSQLAKISAGARAWAPERAFAAFGGFFGAPRATRFFCRAARRKSLKRLDPDERIQGSPRQKFCWILLAFVPARLGLAKFGLGLDPRRAASRRSGPRPAIVARTPFGPRAVIEALDLAAGLLHRQRQNRGRHARAAGGDDRLPQVDPMRG